MKIKNTLRKTVAIKLLLAFLIQIAAPTSLWALTGGPSQPEVQSFEPVNTSEMVDLFSGDFVYNIPLLDVEGYPINLSYHSGISMDEEASWVGLGWNINAGVINRSKRGIPDDFDGDEIKTTTNLKRRTALSVGSGISFDLEALGLSAAQLSKVSTWTYNNYDGVSRSTALSLGISASQSSKLPVNMSLGLNLSSTDGATFSPSFSLGYQNKNNNSISTSLQVSIGGSYNSRMGLRSLSVNSTLSATPKFKSKIINAVSGSVTGASFSSNFDLGGYTTTPSTSPDRSNKSFTYELRVGGEVFPMFTTTILNGAVSTSKNVNNEKSTPSFGYLNMQNADENSLMDFNIVDDKQFSEGMSAAYFPSYTYDMFSVAGQGVGGSYRGFRNDIGITHEPITKDKSDIGVDGGGELGGGAVLKAGTDIGVTTQKGKSGRWSKRNSSFFKNTKFRNNPNKLKNGNYYFKQAGELSIDANSSVYENLNEDLPIQPVLKEIAKYNVMPDGRYKDNQGHIINSSGIEKSNRDLTNTPFITIQRKDIPSVGLMEQSYYSSQGSGKPMHHIGEIISTNPQGERYVYSFGLYNYKEEEVSFALGRNLQSQYDPLGPSVNLITQMATYSLQDASEGNTKGIDNYYNSTVTPPYAHSYLLSAVLSTDYIDSDDVRGPSENDFGNYTKFYYQRHAGYKWRIPFETLKCSYNEGLKSDYTDDKGNFVYGEKEVAYLEKVESKNYVAIFETAKRCDARGANGREGGLSTSSTSGYSYYLKSIKLFTKDEYSKYLEDQSGIPVKTVHFEYDYSLCGNVPNFDPNVNDEMNASGNGKLTLKKVYFTYQNSKKGKFSSYNFNYSINPNYNIKNVDRWGVYKPNPSGVLSNLSPTRFNWESPYTEQSTSADSYSAAWHLNEIKLPSGGIIKVNYESDRYAYVQDRLAREMVEILGTSADNESVPENTHGILTAVTKDEENHRNRKLYFPIASDVLDINQYVSEGDEIFYKALVSFDDRLANYTESEIENFTEADISNFPNFNAEYVPGYAKVIKCGISQGRGWMILEPLKMDDNGNNSWSSEEWSPICKGALQFGQANLRNLIYNVNLELGDNMVTSTIMQAASALIGVVSSSLEIIEKPYKFLYTKHTKPGRFIVPRKSQVRLKSSRFGKYGGGSRVKSIEVSDSWGQDGHVMDNSSESAHSVIQTFSYVSHNGLCSGVASFEPAVGGEENALKTGKYTSTKRKGAPDPRFLQEYPIGEVFYPNPQVGYSRVVVQSTGEKSLLMSEQQTYNLERSSTGKTVHEFYTSRDFPTISANTKLVNADNLIRHKSANAIIQSLFKAKHQDVVTLTQGISVVVNDMHGKPKKTEVFAENSQSPISSTEYKYKSHMTGFCEGNEYAKFELDNKCTSIDQKGVVHHDVQLGVFHELMLHERENMETSISIERRANVDVCALFVPVPTLWPSYKKHSTTYRSITATKLIQKFGIVDEIIAKQDGSVVSTKNIAYDANTGSVLATSTINEYNDELYSLNLPAYWYYKGMGPACENLNVEHSALFDGSGKAILQGANKYFFEGDELLIEGSNGSQKAWVVSSNDNGFRIINRQGAPIPGQYSVKVVRSGHRNVQSAMMASITTSSNPIMSLVHNSFGKVLQASAVAYQLKWPTSCNCSPTEMVSPSLNPFINGTKGVWKPSTSFLHLSPRTQSKTNNNTDIRNDGYFTSFNPFYRRNETGEWEIDFSNWTYVSEVSLFSPYGPELENRDALGRYSSAAFGFNQTLPIAVAANSRYKEMNFESFEDYTEVPDNSSDPMNKLVKCSDKKFRIYNPENSELGYLVADAHTGRNALKVVNSYEQIENVNNECIGAECELDLVYEIDQENQYMRIYPIYSSGYCNLSRVIITGNPDIEVVPNPYGYTQEIRIGLDSSWEVKVIALDIIAGQVKSENFNN